MSEMMINIYPLVPGCQGTVPARIPETIPDRGLDEYEIIPFFSLSLSFCLIYAFKIILLERGFQHKEKELESYTVPFPKTS